MLMKDCEKVYQMIQRVDLPPEMFVKDSRVTIVSQALSSYVAEDSGKIVGALLLGGDLIDTIVSEQQGAASKMLTVLRGRYMTYVSPLNSKSQAMFERNGFVRKHKTQMYGQERLLYEGVL